MPIPRPYLKKRIAPRVNVRLPNRYKAQNPYVVEVGKQSKRLAAEKAAQVNREYARLEDVHFYKVPDDVLIVKPLIEPIQISAPVSTPVATTNDEITFDYSALPKFCVIKKGVRSTYSLHSTDGSMGCGAATMSYVSMSLLSGPKVEWEPTPEAFEACCKWLVRSIKAYSMVILSDAVNYETPGKIDQLAPYAGAQRIWNTGKFIEYLAKYRIGNLYLSPIVRNQQHRIFKDYSLAQVAVWIPPQFQEMIVPNTGGMIGDMRADKDQWVTALNKDYGVVNDWKGWKEQIFPKNSVLFENMEQV